MTNTLVLLIGVSEFPEDNSIHPIPNVKQNIVMLENILIDNNLVGIPQQNITISMNETKLEILRKLNAISKKAENNNYTLIVYYAGHGIINNNNLKLYLSTSNSTKISLESDSIEISEFQYIISNSQAGRKVIILDACHSGHIHNQIEYLESKLSIELKKYENIHIMSSVSEDGLSLFPADINAPTYFTGFFIDTIKKGINNNKPNCSLKDIYNEVQEKIIENNEIPYPKQSNYKNADEFIFCKNNSYNPFDNENEMWSHAVIDNTFESYKKFIKLYPNSKFSEHAITMINLLSLGNEENENFVLSNIGNNKLNLNFENSSQLINNEKNINIITNNQINNINLNKKITKTLYFKVVSIIFIIVTSFAVVFLLNNSAIQSKKAFFANNIDNSKIRNYEKKFVKTEKNKIQELMLLAEENTKKGEDFYNDALKLYFNVIELNPNYQLAKDKIAEINNLKNQLTNQYISDANTYLKVDKNSSKALELLNKALKLDPNNITLIVKIEQVKVENINN